MIKSNVVSSIANMTGYNKKIVKNILEGFFDTVEQELSKGNSVVLRGFGTFEVKKRAKRKGMNVYTGESLEIPEKAVPSFKPAESLKSAVSGANFQ